MYVEIQKPINNALKIKLTEILEKKPSAALKHSVDNKDIYICITYPYLLFTKLYFQVIFQQLMTQNLEHIFFFKTTPFVRGEKQIYSHLALLPLSSRCKHSCLAALGVYQLYILLYLIIPVIQHL